ncbi:MAG: autotransporter-associated beta strand repeat-containing protein [Planctomycetaceae bacterium]|nr:autotransporter-associated beta strand repeat-containing protein [Planctomycetaceae bacterium]
MKTIARPRIAAAAMAALILATVCVPLSVSAGAAEISATADQPGGANWNQATWTGGQWSDGLVPSSGKDYVTAHVLRTSEIANSTFGGGSLRIAAGGVLSLKQSYSATSRTAYVNNLILDGGMIVAGNTTNSGVYQNVDADIEVRSASTISLGGDASRHIKFINGALSGSGDVLVTGYSTATDLYLDTTLTSTHTGNWTVTTAKLVATRDDQIYDQATVTLSNGNSHLDIRSDQRIGSLTGSGRVTSGATGSRTLSVGGNGASTAFSGIVQNGSGTMSLTKEGAGTLTLSGSNPYTGATSITAGTLELSGAGAITGSSGITVNGAMAALITNSSTAVARPITITQGTIGGTGAVNTAVTIGSGAIISPGNSPGSQSYLAGMTWNAGGSYRFEINNATGTAETNWDLLNISGALNLAALNASNRFNILLTSLTLGNIGGNAANFDPTATCAWLLADSDTTISTFTGSEQFFVNTAAFTNPVSGTFAVVRGDSVTGGDTTQLYLQYTGIPEPASATLLVIGVVGMILRRRSSHNDRPSAPVLKGRVR